MKNKTKLVVTYIVFFLLAVISLVPFIMMMANAGRSNLEILSSVSLLPSGHFIENWKQANQMAPLLQGLFNSSVVAVLSTALSIYFSTLIAYGFSAYNFKGKNIMFTVLLLTMMIPGQLSFLGFYEMVKQYGMLNSYLPLIIPGIANAGTVFFLKQYSDQVFSKEIVESARIDGASELKIFHKIMLPIYSPAMATMAIFTFIGSWNNYLTPLLIINKTEKYTLPLMVRYISGVAAANPAYGSQSSVYMAIFISTLPIVIVFIIFSRKIIDGLSSGAVKG